MSSLKPFFNKRWCPHNWSTRQSCADHLAGTVARSILSLGPYITCSVRTCAAHPSSSHSALACPLLLVVPDLRSPPCLKSCPSGAYGLQGQRGCGQYVVNCSTHSLEYALIGRHICALSREEVQPERSCFCTLNPVFHVTVNLHILDSPKGWL